MREWLEVLLKTLAIILVIGVIIVVGIHIFKQVTLGMKVCLENSSMESPVNCTLLNEQQHSGVVDGWEKWSWLEHNLSWIHYCRECFGVEK